MSQTLMPAQKRSPRKLPLDEAESYLRRRVQTILDATAPVMLVASEPKADLAAPRFRFRGAAARLQDEHAPEVLLSGPAGTGKSLACLWKLHAACAGTSNVRALIVRKTRASLTESALVTLERDVLPAGAGLNLGAGRANRHSYRYPNGSEIVVGGLGDADQVRRVMSTEFDVIFCQEAIELSLNEWESLTTRLRSNVLPCQQMIADTNPDAPTHWLRRRAASGQTLMLESRHEDNPALWDTAARDGAGDWTAFGVRYIATLDALTGPRRARLRDGKWVQAEGVVYDGWNPAMHVIDPFHIPRDWPRYWAVDFGFTNPFVCQWWARDPDGRLYMYREIYRTQRLVEDHAAVMLQACGYRASNGAAAWELATDPRPVAIVCDHDAEGRETLVRHLGIGNVAARKEVQAGIQAVAARLKVAGDGKPRLFVFRGATVERDAALDAARKPCSTVEEFDGYVWRTGTTVAARGKEEPVKENDHGLDCVRYMCFYLDGSNSTPYIPTTAQATTWVDEGPGVW